MTALLASVANLAEARLMAAAGADLIDLKDPARGALGALPADEAARIVADLVGTRPVSATIGDLPLAAELVVPAVEERAAAGVSYVKIGFFPGGDPDGVLAALEPVARRGVRLVAVLFADRDPDLALVPALAAAGFAGAMLDTADKGRGSLLQVLRPGSIAGFVAAARGAGLLVGLAGSLRSGDVAPLAELAPDYLGFRGALCGGDRNAGIDPEAAARIVTLVQGARPARSLLESTCSID